MRITVLLTVFFCFINSAYSDVVIRGLLPGTHYLKIDVNADYSATASRIPSITVPPTDPTVPPVTPPVTPPTGITGVARVAYDSAKQINRPDEARILAGIYLEIARQLETGVIDVAQAADDVTEATNLILSLMGAKERWAPFKTNVMQYWAINPPRDVAAVIAGYKSLSKGLEDSAIGAAIDFDFIANLAIRLLAEKSKMAAISPEVIMQLLQAIRDRDFMAIIALIVSLLLGGI